MLGIRQDPNEKKAMVESSSDQATIKTGELALAGAISGAASRIVTAPLDLLKIRFQLQVGPIASAKERQALAYNGIIRSLKKVVREESIVGLWRGNLAATYLWIGYGAIQFPVYEYLKVQLGPFMAGAGAGLLATVVTYPFDVIRTQFAAQGLPRVHKSMYSFVNFTLQNQGIAGLFVGLTPTAVQIIPRMGLAFSLYDRVDPAAEGPPRDWIEEAYRWCVSALYGGIAGGIGRIIPFPFDTIKRRMQAQVVVSEQAGIYGQMPTFRNSWECALFIVKNEGFTALYKGLTPTLLKSMTSTSVIFAVYGLCKDRIILASSYEQGDSENNASSGTSR